MSPAEGGTRVAVNYFRLLSRRVELGEGFEHSKRSPRGAYNGQPLGNTAHTQPLTRFKRKKTRRGEGNWTLKERPKCVI